MSEELKQACDNLPLEDMVEMREYLSALIKNATGKGDKSPERCSMLMGAMASLQGKQTISLTSRDTEDVWARTFVAYQMLNEGYTTTEIGEQMQKDHATIIYLRKKMQDVFELPWAYRDILEQWNEFQKRIQL